MLSVVNYRYLMRRKVLNTTPSLDYQINRVGFWSVIAAFALAVMSAFFPLDAPGGSSAAHADRIAWLSANSGVFITAWAIQIAWMAAWCGTMFVLAWKIAGERPIQAVVAAMVVLVSFVAFIIPKFMAIWTIPLLADAVSNGALGAAMADSLLLLLNVSIPFSLYTSFDYLGFWMYAIFALLVARPLYHQAQQSVSAKITAFALGAFGILFHCMMVGVFIDSSAVEYLEGIVGLCYLFIFLAFGAAAFNFKRAMSS